MRKKIIAGNWKMNYSANEAEDFVESIIDRINTIDVDVVIFPNFTALDRISKVLDSKNVKLGAQNVYFESKGAYTGETSVDMLYSLGVSYCLVGHSERRQQFKETNQDVNKKLKALLEKEITPIMCVGETLEERNSEKLYDIILEQIKVGLDGIDKELVRTNIVIAYEPIWAIGTGVTATDEQAEEMCEYIRKVIKDLYDEKTSQLIRIQYGGSVKPSNVSSILKKDNIDGVLVGGASITEDFVAIVNYEN